MSAYSIAGGWLGSYYYADGEEPCRFEAGFEAVGGEGRFLGRILDDGPLGEANAEGVQSGMEVAFTKVYIRPPDGYGTAPVEYEGTLSEDGKRLTGTWSISSSHGGGSGTWEARRLWFEAAAEDARTESEGLLAGAR